LGVAAAAAATVVVAVIWVCASFTLDSHQMVMCCKNGQKRNFSVREYLLTTQDGLVGEMGEMLHGSILWHHV
jgi:hypothetical protein